ncbi:MAG: hypothetical protein WBN57_10540, partial [Gammaproteobacteria bacterium]
QRDAALQVRQVHDIEHARDNSNTGTDSRKNGDKGITMAPFRASVKPGEIYAESLIVNTTSPHCPHLES